MHVIWSSSPLGFPAFMKCNVLYSLYRFELVSDKVWLLISRINLFLLCLYRLSYPACLQLIPAASVTVGDTAIVAVVPAPSPSPVFQTRSLLVIFGNKLLFWTVFRMRRCLDLALWLFCTTVMQIRYRLFAKVSLVRNQLSANRLFLKAGC